MRVLVGTPSLAAPLLVILAGAACNKILANDDPLPMPAPSAEHDADTATGRGGDASLVGIGDAAGEKQAQDGAQGVESDGAGGVEADGATGESDETLANESSGSEPRDVDASIMDSGGTDADASSVDDGVTGPSCNRLPNTCGPLGSANCCRSSLVPAGTFDRSNDPAAPATVSAFRLDIYETTVGRFRNFVAAFSPEMIAAGAGKNPNNPDDPGWDPAWNAYLPGELAVATSSTKYCGYQTWTNAPALGENRPISCVDWYLAAAFCIWDGGRLPTEAEWNYAAAGGNEQRKYPWGIWEPDCTYANFFDVDHQCLLAAGPFNVGTDSPRGDAKWGQADMGGNVWEWVQDWYATPYATPCTDCANLTKSTYQVFRGGSTSDYIGSLFTYRRSTNEINDGENPVGMRCARAP